MPTPRKDHAGSTDNVNRRSKKPHTLTIAKKAFNAPPASASASEDLSEVTSRESLDFSTISEISDAEILSPADGSSQTLISSDLTLFSKDIPEIDKSGITSDSQNHFGSYFLDSSGIASLEAEVVVNFLRKTCCEILSSTNADHRHRKLLEELTNVVIAGLCTLPAEEKDRFAEVLSMRKKILFLGFLFWIVGVSFVLLFFASDDRSAFRGPLPT